MVSTELRGAGFVLGACFAAMPRQLRVVCSSTGGAGHIHALAPIAQALRERGHDVRWAVAADGGEAVAAMGFEWSGAGLTTAARRAAAAGSIAGVMELAMEKRRAVLFAEFFARTAGPAMRTDLVPIIERFRPDVVLREMAELAAAPVAAARGIPLVTVAFSGVLPEQGRPRVIEALRPLWQAEGLADPSWPDVYGQLYLHPFPASFGQRPDSPVVRPRRPESGAASAERPAWVGALGSRRPFVYVTSGTEPAATTFPWRAVFAVVGGVDVDVVATIGPHVDTDALGAVPANVRVERFVPQRDVLAQTSVVVSHGGAGTVLGAAAHGRPQLVVPLFADQWENGTAVKDAGCGVVLGPDGRGIEDVERALQTLLTGSVHP